MFSRNVWNLVNYVVTMGWGIRNIVRGKKCFTRSGLGQRCVVFRIRGENESNPCDALERLKDFAYLLRLKGFMLDTGVSVPINIPLA